MSLRDDYDRVFRSLSRVELQSGHELDDADLPNLFRGGKSNLWLGFYTEEGLWVGLDRYGLWERFRAIGYEEVQLEIRCDDPDEHLLRIWSVRPKIDVAPLLELVVRRGSITSGGDLEQGLGPGHIAVLNVEWLQLQSPDRRFTEERLPLPGQQFPGLGLGREILELLRQACKRIGAEGLVTVPSYFHNAYLYVSEFSYVDPHPQGIFLALCRDVLPQAYGSIACASWAVTLGMVVEEPDDEPFEWFHDVMVAPISERLTTWVTSTGYRRAVADELKRGGFRVLDSVLTQELEARGIRPLDRRKIKASLRRA